MKHSNAITQEKMGRILDELYTALFAAGAHDISMNIKRWNDGLSICLHADYDPSMECKIQDLARFLQPEVKNNAFEETYWALVGCDRTGEDSELMLVGQMIDSADIFIEPYMVHLVLFKKYE